MRGEIDLAGMALFVRVVENGSLSAAGRDLGLPKATVSRRLRLLEASIGAPLLTRSTRALSLTDTGRRFFERVRPIVHDAEAAQSEIRTSNIEPTGRLRLTAPVAFGQAVIAPKLIQFLEQHRRVQADLHFSDDRINIIAEGFDLAIRMGELADSDLISKRLTELAMVVVAAPSYIAAHGGPEDVLDLQHHTAVLTHKNLDHWSINGETVRVSWRINTGNVAVTRDAVRAGLGISRLPAFFVAEDLADGKLVQLLPQYELPKTVVTALYPRSIVPSPALRTLIGILPEWCR
jgi:DNA-binding transcriptional LysR family regulator